MRVVFVWYAF